jgi:hypothetical protein
MLSALSFHQKPYIYDGGRQWKAAVPTHGSVPSCGNVLYTLTLERDNIIFVPRGKRKPGASPASGGQSDCRWCTICTCTCRRTLCGSRAAPLPSLCLLSDPAAVAKNGLVLYTVIFLVSSVIFAYICVYVLSFFMIFLRQKVAMRCKIKSPAGTRQRVSATPSCLPPSSTRRFPRLESALPSHPIPRSPPTGTPHTPLHP